MMRELENLLSAHSHILIPETMDAELMNSYESDQPEHPLFI